MAQANHVFGVLALAFVAHAGLRHHERLEAFFAKLGQHGGGGDIGVPLRTARAASAKMDGPRGESGRRTAGNRCAARGAESETGCELHGLSPDKRGLLFTPHTGFLDSEPSLSAVCVVGTRNPVGPVATVFPEFIARAQRSARTGPSRSQAQGWCGPQAQPRHGPARLDGTRSRATVAGKVMKSGRRLDKATAIPLC